MLQSPADPLRARADPQRRPEPDAAARCGRNEILESGGDAGPSGPGLLKSEEPSLKRSNLSFEFTAGAIAAVGGSITHSSVPARRMAARRPDRTKAQRTGTRQFHLCL